MKSKSANASKTTEPELPGLDVPAPKLLLPDILEPTILGPTIPEPDMPGGPPLENNLAADFPASRPSPWIKAYWFARMAINGDKYGGVGKDSALMAAIAAAVRQRLDDPEESDPLQACRVVIRAMLVQRFARAAALSARVELFCKDLEEELQTINAVRVFLLTLERILIPTNEALKRIPSNDRDFTETAAKAYLDQWGEAGLARVLKMWDNLGVAGCLAAERAAIAIAFGNLRRALAAMTNEDSPESRLTETDADLILTAFAQEFERRLGQKRKGRAGGSLEDAASFLFTYFGVKAAHAPDHFQADIEVDKWVKDRDGWLIGLSCKRTLRERWKQVTSADRKVLSRYKIKQIWHLVTYDEDLSDDKLTLLGGLDHVFYLPDESRRLDYAQAHIGLKAYVRPISAFIHDLRQTTESKTASEQFSINLLQIDRQKRGKIKE